MSYYPTRRIKNDEEFNPDSFPQLLQDMNQINEATAHVPHAFKADILISFTKSHSLDNEWIKASPEFSRLVSTGALPVKEIEALFEASSGNSVFQQQLESFLKKSMSRSGRIALAKPGTAQKQEPGTLPKSINTDNKIK